MDKLRLTAVVLSGGLRFAAPDEVPGDVELIRVEDFGTHAHLFFGSASWPRHHGCCPPVWSVEIVDSLGNVKYGGVRSGT